MKTYKLVSNDELYHHGIFGQRWGVRNGPPYPLDNEDHSAREKKAGWKASLNNGGKTSSKKEKSINTSTSKKRRSVSFKQAHQVAKDAKESYNKSTYKSDEDYELSEESKRKLKALGLTCAIIAGAGVGIYAASKYDVAHKLSVLYDNKTLSEILEYIQNNKAHSKANEIKNIIADSIGKNADYIIKKGQSFQRIASSENSILGDYTYASYKFKDNLSYKGFLLNHAGTKNQYVLSLKAIDDLKAPGKQTAMKIFENMLSNDPELRGKSKYLKDPKYLEQTFDNFITGFVFKDREINQKYKKELLKSGYNAIFDYHDILDKVANKPLIILDPDKHLVKEGEHLLTSGERGLAQFLDTFITSPEFLSSVGIITASTVASSIMDEDEKNNAKKG